MEEREREKTSIQKPIAVGSFDVEAEAAAVAVEALDKYRAFRVDATKKLTGARISFEVHSCSFHRSGARLASSSLHKSISLSKRRRWRRLAKAAAVQVL